MLLLTKLFTKVGQCADGVKVFMCQLQWMDMVINTKKSCCLRVSPRHKVTCNNITNINKIKLEWCKEIRYLGVYITSANLYCCSFKYAKQAAYRSFNAIFGKIGRIASDEVVLE